REAGEDEIQQDEWIRIESAHAENDVHQNPDTEKDAEERDEAPASAKRSDLVGPTLAAGEGGLKAGLDIGGEQFVLAEALNNVVFKRGKFANVFLEDGADILGAEGRDGS